MLRILAISILPVASTIAGCEYGRSEILNDTCNYYCQSGSDATSENKYFNLSSLPFDYIKSECSNVRMAADNGICDGIQDLVYRNDTCGCPYCECQSPQSDLTEYLTNWPTKVCMNCTCQQPSPNQCSTTIWNQPEIKEAGDSWWTDVADSDTDCQTFCHCPSEGEAICKTGWENIFADEWLKVAFMDECGDSDEDTGAVKLFHLHKPPGENS